ncbi:methylated-DNA--protein-cysteine methyltransferase [Nanoarchaeota archaeon]
MINIFNQQFYSGYIIKENKILAYSLNTNQEKLIKQLESIARFHNLDGDLIFDEKLDKFFEEKIKKFLNGERFSFDLSYYRNKEVYEELSKLDKLITYKELKEKVNISYIELIRTLKNNPFIILIPCHRVIKSNNEVGGYTPLGKEFKIKLLKMEGYL